MIWPFDPLQRFSYDLIMADPPWRFRLWSEAGEAKSPQAHYATMSIAEIADLPVGHLAARDCILFLWTTWPMLLDPGDAGRNVAGDPSFSPPGSVMKAWGFRYCTGGSWKKTTINGKTAFGPGYRIRSACEPFLIGVMGNPSTPGASTTRNLIEGLAREHSRKPEEVYPLLENYMPRARRLDLFSRQQRAGWDSWGREATKFNTQDPYDDGWPDARKNSDGCYQDAVDALRAKQVGQ